MKVRIHRGARQIGGTCIEVATELLPGRVVLDLGLPLDADPDAIASLMPDVPGLHDASGDLMDRRHHFGGRHTRNIGM